MVPRFTTLLLICICSSLLLCYIENGAVTALEEGAGLRSVRSTGEGGGAGGGVGGEARGGAGGGNDAGGKKYSTKSSSGLESEHESGEKGGNGTMSGGTMSGGTRSGGTTLTGDETPKSLGEGAGGLPSGGNGEKNKPQI
ncbi:unnamed protein product [Bemisia tabaci]|uniref:Uncharacterized protein n=1 Tax=Bemisia tabaci TaxID=7038 RepID=A0A9P0AJ78_BEMTA|nr:unnamed protein product [Bemisia tabaci]